MNYFFSKKNNFNLKKTQSYYYFLKICISPFSTAGMFFFPTGQFYPTLSKITFCSTVLFFNATTQTICCFITSYYVEFCILSSHFYLSLYQKNMKMKYSPCSFFWFYILSATSVVSYLWLHCHRCRWLILTSSVQLQPLTHLVNVKEMHTKWAPSKSTVAFRILMI